MNDINIPYISNLPSTEESTRREYFFNAGFDISDKKLYYLENLLDIHPDYNKPSTYKPIKKSLDNISFLFAVGNELDNDIIVHTATLPTVWTYPNIVNLELPSFPITKPIVSGDHLTNIIPIKSIDTCDIIPHEIPKELSYIETSNDYRLFKEIYVDGIWTNVSYAKKAKAQINYKVQEGIQYKQLQVVCDMNKNNFCVKPNVENDRITELCVYMSEDVTVLQNNIHVRPLFESVKVVPLFKIQFTAIKSSDITEDGIRFIFNINMERLIEED